MPFELTALWKMENLIQYNFSGIILLYYKGFFLLKTNLLHPKRILHLLPKVYRKFRTSFLSEPKPQFRVFFGKDSFLITQSHFRQAYCKTQPWTFLVNGGVPIFTIALFMQKFPISSSKSLVCFKIFLFFLIDRFSGIPWLFICKSTTKS